MSAFISYRKRGPMFQYGALTACYSRSEQRDNMQQHSIASWR